MGARGAASRRAEVHRSRDRTSAPSSTVPPGGASPVGVPARRGAGTPTRQASPVGALAKRKLSPQVYFGHAGSCAAQVCPFAKPAALNVAFVEVASPNLTSQVSESARWVRV